MNGLLGYGARVVDGATGAAYGGRDLRDRIDQVHVALSRAPCGAVFALTALSIDCVLRYLGAWEARRPIALLDPQIGRDELGELARLYQPGLITGVSDGAGHHETGSVPEGYVWEELDGVGSCWARVSDLDCEPHADLGVLLATSGSTGSPKLVRLPRTAVMSNAKAIGSALQISHEDLAATCLPLFYSYGMSVLNSHLAAGAGVLVADGGLLSRDFWNCVATYRATALSGVPYSFHLLDRLGWDPADYPRIKVLTQAGGKLGTDLIESFDRRMRTAGGRMYVMWGQTEAAPRMSTLPASQTSAKLGSVGPALDGGHISVETADGVESVEPGVRGEVIYRGSNVMWGYARSAADLGEGDQVGGILRTGDLGWLDNEGCLWLTGRISRIGKVCGIRVNLDDVERILEPMGRFAAVECDDRLLVFGVDLPAAIRARAREVLSRALRLHRSGFVVESVESLPHLANGKPDYRALKRGLV